MAVASELNKRLLEWNAGYGSAMLPPNGVKDAAWVREGVQLLAEVRLSLGEAYRVEASDPWWSDEDPNSSV